MWAPAHPAPARAVWPVPSRPCRRLTEADDHGGGKAEQHFLAIDPIDCIDCAVCVPECPVDAIDAEENALGEQQDFSALHAELARQGRPTTKTKPVLPDDDAWAKVKDERSSP